MPSFSSFKTIAQAEPRVEELLEHHDKYYAHTHAMKPFETLEEHVCLVMEYAATLVNQHGLDEVIDKMILSLLRKHTEKTTQLEVMGAFIKKLFVNALLFHDYGKVNENFQVAKMKNSFFTTTDKHDIDSQHSILSAYIFLQKHLGEIVEMKGVDNNGKNDLILYTLLFASPITKHHAPFLKRFEGLSEKRFDDLQDYLKKWSISFKGKLKSLLVKTEKIYLMKLSQLQQESESFFPLVTLLKLCFSLLTASDYYATNDFMQDMRVRNFGILDEVRKQKLYDDFRSNPEAPYNKLLMEQTETLRNIPFHKLQERSRSNLNRLRQKMAAEAVTTVRRHKEQRLFYLEAPTGGGKTNMAFACTLELLKADNRLNKAFYVFPFTTLVTQTHASIKKTLRLEDDEVIQLHAKAGFHSPPREAEIDGKYGAERLNFVQNIFVNYPFTLLSHIKFFDILKSNAKEVNYLLHRMSNSVVVIDELQTYDPKHWDKIILFLDHYAHFFNIRFILMSATLPKIGDLSNNARGKITYLLKDKKAYFTNPNFKGRIEFDFSLLKKYPKANITPEQLRDFVYEKSEAYAVSNDEQVNSLIEFITKKRAGEFYRLIAADERFSKYQLFLISGTILEPRRQEIIRAIQENTYKGSPFEKCIVVTTQVIEAGVDIDMDIGFKDRSLIDSDEQLAGRVNRNASKQGCKVYLFDLDKTYIVYKEDKRYEAMRKAIPLSKYELILNDKDFDKLYRLVFKAIDKLNESILHENLEDYLELFRGIHLREIHERFRLIDSQTSSVFIPLTISSSYFSASEQKFLSSINILSDAKVDGSDVFSAYKNIVLGEGLFVQKMINKKQIAGVMSKFMFSVYTNSKLEKELQRYADAEIFEQFGLLYLSHWTEVYEYESGIMEQKFSTDIFL